MAYYSGSATSFANLLASFSSALVAQGWTARGSGWYDKGAVNIRLQSFATYLALQASGEAPPGTAALAPTEVRLGHYVTATGLLFPVNYEIFIHTDPDEVYLVVNHSVDRYAWLAFGQSTIAVPGTGVWIGATAYNRSAESIYLTATSAGGAYGSTTNYCPAGLFVADTKYANAYVNHGFVDQQSSPWGGASGSAFYSGENLTQAWRMMGGLCNLLPNTWNGETVLLPIQAYTARPESKVSLTVDVQHARYARIDNYEPGDIITLGPDRWKVFPWWRKNLAVRNGGVGDHTGTWGWAIRYDGP